jgi:hypothetical protein
LPPLTFATLKPPVFLFSTLPRGRFSPSQILSFAFDYVNHSAIDRRVY